MYEMVKNMKNKIQRLGSICLLILLGLSLIPKSSPIIEAAASEPTTYALKFEHLYDHVAYVPDNAAYNFSDGDFTVAMWLYNEPICGDGMGVPTWLGKHDVDWEAWWYYGGYLPAPPDVEISWYMDTTAGGQQPPDGLITTVNEATNDQTWRYVVVTVDGITPPDNMNLYIDGQFYVAGNNSLNVDNNGVITIGGDYLDDYYHANSTIDDIQFYNRSWSANEVSANYNNGVGLYQPYNSTGLVLWLKMTEGSGSTLYDHSPIHNHGTIVNATWSTGVSRDWFPIGSLYIQTDYNTTLSAVSSSSTDLTFTLTADSGVTSTTQVYCASRGRPTNVIGVSSWSYSQSTNRVTLNVVHSSPEEVILEWTIPEQTRTSILSSIWVYFGLISLLPLILGASLIVGLFMKRDEEWSSVDFVGVISIAVVIVAVVYVSIIIVNAFTSII